MTAVRASLNAFLDLPDVPVANAQSGLLAGLSLGVKDIFDVAGYVTGCGSPTWAAQAKPASRTATAVQMLLDAGARFAGKTQTEELAFSMTGQNVHFPYPVNARAPDRVTGGSSSGSAAAVAGGLADIAVGSDTNGSIRAPASYCGLVGLRTTHGRIPLDGAMPLAPSLDTFGWFARDIDVYAKVGEVLLKEPASQTARPNRLLSIAALDELVLGPAEADEYRRMTRLVSDVLGPPKATAAPSQPLDNLYWCLRKLQAKEAWAVHGKWILAEDRNLAPAIDARFRFGATVSLPEALAEGARRKAFRAELGDMLGDDGLLVLPTVPGAAPKSDSTAEEFGDFRERAIRAICWSGLSGFPQITLPLGEVHGAPFGISLLGPAGSDMALIRLGRKILEANGKA